jgi:uncharacterized phage protein (predicted DNA packaging)
MLDVVKMALRIKHNALDSEIIDLIEVARQDLILSGILSTKANDDTDALVRQSIIFYCKAFNGFDNPDAERYHMAYKSLKEHLTLTSEYTVEAV